MKSSKLITIIAAGFAFAFLTGCASIISGRHQEVTFTSNPDNAVVTINGRQIGKTPITSQLERKWGAQVVTIEKDGYKTVTFQLKSSVNGWFFGNLILGGLLGSTTDSSTGAINAYSQDMYNFSLNPMGASIMPEKTEIKSFVITNYKNIIEELNIQPRVIDPKNKNTASLTGVDIPKPYLKSLLSLLKVKQDQEDIVIKVIKDLSVANKDIVAFGDQVANLAQ